MQILNENSMSNHTNHHWGDDHHYDMLDAESQALWEHYVENCDEYW